LDNNIHDGVPKEAVEELLPKFRNAEAKVKQAAEAIGNGDTSS
jgi:hypothetical protein